MLYIFFVFIYVYSIIALFFFIFVVLTSILCLVDFLELNPYIEVHLSNLEQTLLISSSCFLDMSFNNKYFQLSQ